MAFKLKSDNDDGDVVGKMYLYAKYNAAGLPGTDWVYVSADASTVVDGSGYIDRANDATQGDHPEIAIAMLKVGDIFHAYQVASIDDTRAIEADMRSGISDYSVHIVLENNGTWIDLSDEGWSRENDS